MIKNKRLDLCISFLFIAFLASSSISLSLQDLFLPKIQTCEGSTFLIEDTPKLSWELGWQTDGKPICKEISDQIRPQICSDGNGGAIITWMDFRGVSNPDIYAQSVSSNGVIEGTNDGVAICTQFSSQFTPQICSDGSGGAIIAWSGTSQVFAQCLNSSSNTHWTDDGVTISTGSISPYRHQICGDGNGGAILTWKDERNGGYDIYAQRVNSNGIIQWSANDVEISTARSTQDLPQICSDGDGGAIIVWQDYRYNNYDVYAQRINSNGVVQWIANGTVICTESSFQVWSQICSDGNGGAIITWVDYRHSSYDIYAQHINSNGVVQWTDNGMAICTERGYQTQVHICGDGDGGAIITWKDERLTFNNDIYAQKINSNGVVQWSTSGQAICKSSGHQVEPRICSDGSEGAIISWIDYESDSSSDIYTQRINSDGVLQWTPNGIQICTASNEQIELQICSDGVGGAIIIWQDNRTGSNYDIYAQRIFTPTSISFGFYFLPFSFIGLIFVVLKWRRKMKKKNEPIIN